jgi:hypothetical protein
VVLPELANFSEPVCKMHIEVHPTELFYESNEIKYDAKHATVCASKSQFSSYLGMVVHAYNPSIWKTEAGGP